MTDSEAYFDFIADRLSSQIGVARGKMMSSPGLKCKGKVFAFYHKEQMGFKLGKDFDPEAFGIDTWSYLSPFKQKPPMKAWFLIPFSEKEQWEKLANLALEKAQ